MDSPVDSRKGCVEVETSVTNLKKRENRTGYWVRVHYLKIGKRTWRKMGETRQQSLRNRNKLLTELAKEKATCQGVKFGEAIRRFRRWRNGRIKENTRKTEEAHVKAWKGHFKQKRTDLITLRDVENLFFKMEKDWKGPTLNKSKTLLRAFFKYCREHRWMKKEEDLTRTLPTYTNDPEKPIVSLTQKQCSALLKACQAPYTREVKGKRNRSGPKKGRKKTGLRVWTQTMNPPDWLFPVVFTALRTLMRLGNILDLTWRNVDIKHKTIKLKPKENKTGATVEIPITDDLIEVLGPPGVVDERVFPTAPTDRRGVTKPFASAVERAGVPKCTFHDLRKTGATQLLDAGVPLHVVQAMGGWKRPDVLLKFYARASHKAKREAADVLAGLVRIHS